MQRVVVHIYFAVQASKDAKFVFNQHLIIITYKEVLESIQYVRTEKSVVESIEIIQDVSNIVWEFK